MVASPATSDAKSSPVTSRAPHSAARGERRIGLGVPRPAVLIARDQRQRRRKRHLEARMHHRLRREQQHCEGRDRNGAEGERRAIEHDADEHDRDHDEGRWVATSLPDSSR